MYVFFEHHKDADGTVLATDVICSSFEHGIGIAWKRDQSLFEIMKRLLKTPPLEKRSYNESLKIWTYLGTSGFSLLEIIQDTFTKLRMGVEFREVQDLESQVAAGGIAVAKQKKIDPKTFFYNAAPISHEITREQASAKLKELFAVTDKRSYRVAALAFHPDRNGGDGRKMSELNMYWRILNASSES